MEQRPSPKEQGIYDFAKTFASAAFKSERTIAKASGLIRKLDVVLDREVAENQAMLAQHATVACRSGCDHCCHSVVFCSIPELARVVAHIRESFSPEDLSRLIMRLEAYENEVAPSLGFDLHLLRPPCPLLEDGLCLAYGARPFNCRAKNSLDVTACETQKLRPDLQVELPTLPGQFQLTAAIAQGMIAALGDLHIDYSGYDFGRALKIALEQPDAIDRHLAGADVFKPAKPQDRGQTQVYQDVPPKYPHYKKGDPPVGTIEPTDLNSYFHKVYTEAETQKAIDSLTGAHPIYSLRKILVPTVYSSEKEIPIWREKFSQALDAFCALDFDPREAFDALSWMTTFELAYQQLNDRELLSRFGQMVVDKITSKALPELVEPVVPRKREGKIKVGYISYNLRNQNGGKWSLGWLRNHADDFETYAFNLYSVDDQISDQFKEHADHYYHMPGNVPEQAKFIKELGLDVLIYTDIGMAGRNYQYAGLRLAPFQCTAWGHPVTSGLPTIDYYLSSDLMEPANGQDHYREDLIRLAGSGLCYPKLAYHASTLAKATFGLDDGPLILACQNPMKYHPRYDRLYKRITDRTGRPIVFLEGQMPCGTHVVRARMEKAGIRAKWLPKLGASDFVRLLSLADVSIDPPGWNGGNTTVEALALGTPVVTLPGEFMRGRHSLAFLQLANVPGLVAKDEDEYVDLVCDEKRREKAFGGLNADALFEDARPVRDLDAFMRKIARLAFSGS